MSVVGRHPPDHADSGHPGRTDRLPSASRSRLPFVDSRYPLAGVAVAVSAGIALDRWLQIDPQISIIAGCVCLVAWLPARYRNRRHLSSIMLMVGFAAVGALHHRHTVSAPAASNLYTLLSDQPVLLKLRGTVVERPDYFPTRPQRWPGERLQEDLTRFPLDCKLLFENGTWRPASGVLQVDASGIADLTPGDQIEVSGWGSELPRRRNPGQRDIRSLLLSRGFSGILRVDHSGLVTVVQKHQSLREQLRKYLRTRFNATLKRHLGPTALPVAQAILLGDRSGLEETRQLFITTGTMHLLAISGLHIGILASFLYGLARLCRCSPRSATVLMLVVLTLYIDSADARPPMIRAFVLVAVWSLARLLNRPAFSANSLALAGLILLSANPTTLFDTGAQLSFLAVATILWLMAIDRQRNQDRDIDVAVAPDSPRARDALRPAWQRWLFAILRSTRKPFCVSCAIWCVSAPLTAATFRILAPVGIFLNLILIPLVTLALWFGFSGLLAGIVSPAVAMIPLRLFSALIHGLLWITETVSRADLGHTVAAALPPWWIAGFYLAIAGAMLYSLSGRRPCRAWSVAVCWLLFGLAVSGAGAGVSEPHLRCTMLSVGHGLSIVIQTPGNRVMIYDCGSAGRPETASRTLSQFLREQGAGHIDGIVISHSDADHFNGVEQITREFQVGRLIISRHFPDDGQPGTLALIDTAQECSVPVEIVQEGDRLALDPTVRMEILHPASRDHYSSDNAASIVLQIEYAGRRILLTGDIEDEGLHSLLRTCSRPVDVLLAPHHGAAAANPPELAAWAQPGYVVASARRQFDAQTLVQRYGPASRILTTSRSGAITFCISPDGRIELQTVVSGT